MSRPDQREALADLVAAYALDAVDRAEAARAEAAMREDPALREDFDAYREALAAVVASTEPAPSTPSPGVWQRIAAEVAVADDAAPPEPTRVADIRSPRRWVRWGTFVGVAAIAASLLLGLRVVDLQNRLDAGPTVDELAAAALRDPAATVADLAGQEGYEDAAARIVLGDEGTGFVVSDNLPALDAERTYQLWAIVADGGEQRIISAGVLGPDPGVSQFQASADIVGLAITEEIAGGVAVSEAPAVAMWLRDA